MVKLCYRNTISFASFPSKSRSNTISTAIRPPDGFPTIDLHDVDISLDFGSLSSSNDAFKRPKLQTHLSLDDPKVEKIIPAQSCLTNHAISTAHSANNENQSESRQFGVYSGNEEGHLGRYENSEDEEMLDDEATTVSDAQSSALQHPHPLLIDAYPTPPSSQTRKRSAENRINPVLPKTPINLRQMTSLLDSSLRGMICDSPLRTTSGIKSLANDKCYKLAGVSPALFSPGYLEVSCRSRAASTHKKDILLMDDRQCLNDLVC